jgi:hypothetical protein
MPSVSAALLSPRTRDARRWLAERRRRMTREPHRVHYFHQPDDPYSHLAAQVLGGLVERYEVVLEVHLVEAALGGGGSRAGAPRELLVQGRGGRGAGLRARVP